MVQDNPCGISVDSVLFSVSASSVTSADTSHDVNEIKLLKDYTVNANIIAVYNVFLFDFFIIVVSSLGFMNLKLITFCRYI